MTADLLLAVSGEGGEEPNPLIPAAYDLLWGTVCFAIILAVFVTRVWPRMKEIEAKRIEGIEAKLEKAERDRAEAAALLDQYRQQLQEARHEASRIRTEAQSDRKSIVDEARREAEVAAEQVAERSRAQLRAEVAQARAELSRDVGRLAVDLAGKVVSANLAGTDRTRDTVDAFLDELESATDGSRAGSDGAARAAAGAGAAGDGSGGATAVVAPGEGPR